MPKRIEKLRELIDNLFINEYFDGEFPKDRYDVELIVSEIPIIQIKNKNDKNGWMMYSNILYLDYYNKLKERIITEHLAAFRIQQWWKKIFYDPRKHIIHRVMNRKYDEY